MATYALPRAYHLTHAPGDPAARAVPVDHPAGRFVLGGAGSEIQETDARRYGLLPPHDAPAPADKAVRPAGTRASARAVR